MTLREKFLLDHPNEARSEDGYPLYCPSKYEYADDPEWCRDPKRGTPTTRCNDCWDREIPEKTWVEEKAEKRNKKIIYAHVGPFHENLDTPHILDSGARREFGTGAVRDIQEGKGRCDLLPLDVVSVLCDDDGEEAIAILDEIHKFQNDGGVGHLFSALDRFAVRYFEAATMGGACCTMALEVSIHFEEGAKKYGENNWQKGIPVHCYIDSAVRHYLKFLRGDKDEPHDRAVCWNLMCAIWTCKHKPELNDYAQSEISEAIKEMMD